MWHLPAQCIGTMVIFDNQVEALKYGIVYSFVIDLMFKGLGNMSWTWHQQIKSPRTCMFIYRKVSNIRHTKSQNLNASRLIL